MLLNNKLEKLKSILKKIGPVLVAFSGGVDSTFLLAVSAETLKEKLLAVTGVSAATPQSEIVQARALAKKLKVRHELVEDIPPREFWENSAQRCYYCKKGLFRRLKGLAIKNKLKSVIDATNADDQSDYRPGARVLGELGIISPLKDAGLTKLEIRKFSKLMGLPTWKKPAMACLASRIPYGERITPEKLLMVNKAEEFIRGLGFIQVRVRLHGRLGRIEAAPEQISRMARMREVISAKLKTFGFVYVSIDLDGYRVGSLNEVL